MKSQAMVCALVVLCSALSVNSNSTESNILSKADQSLFEYIMNPRQAADELELSPDEESNFIPCFNYYFPILIDFTETYHTNIEACATAFNTQMAALNEKNDKVRANITAISTNVRNLLSTCLSKNDTLDFFDCYALSGAQTVRQVYSISVNASEGASNYRETVRVITSTAENCTKNSGRVYSIGTAKVHKELDDCLANGLKTTGPPTTTV